MYFHVSNKAVLAGVGFITIITLEWKFSWIIFVMYRKKSPYKSNPGESVYAFSAIGDFPKTFRKDRIQTSELKFTFRHV